MAQGKNPPLYLNAAPHTVMQYRLDGQIVEARVTKDLARIALERAQAARTVPSWKGKNVYEGNYWACTTAGFVRYESLLEREFLMWADFDSSITAFSWQPFVLKWPRGTKGHRGHVPDFFCRKANGDGLVVDVKRRDKVDAHEEQFAMTRKVCDDVGWSYQVFSGLSEPRLANLTFLCGFRQSRYAPEPDASDQILAVFDTPTSLREGIETAAEVTRTPLIFVRGSVLHLLWHRRLTVGLDTPLDEDSLLVRNPPSGVR